MKNEKLIEEGRANGAIALNKVEFGGRYDASKRTVDNWIASGLPILKLSERAVRIPLEEGDAWVRQRFLQQRRK